MEIGGNVAHEELETSSLAVISAQEFLEVPEMIHAKQLVWSL